MVRRVPVGGGKYCYTENCRIHSAGNTRSLNPLPEKVYLELRQQSAEELSKLPSMKELVHSMDQEKIAAYSQASKHGQEAALHLYMTPKHRQKLISNISHAPADKKEKLTGLLKDSYQLGEAYQRARARFYYGGVYNDAQGDKVQAIPLSLNNISEVNEWVSSFYVKDLPPVAFDENGEDLTVEEKEVANAQDVQDKKTKTRVFRKKHKLFFSDHEGNESELTSANYLVRKPHREGFELVKADVVENDYKIFNDQDTPALAVPERAVFFPSKKLSEYIEI